MKRKRIYKTIISLVTILAILFGSTGFVIQSHECSHTGIKTYALAGSHSSVEACCNDEHYICCSEPGDKDTSCMLSDDSCCKHEQEKFSLPGFTISEKDSNKQFQPFANESVYKVIPEKRVYHTAFEIPFYNKRGGKFLLLVNCQFLA